MTISLTLIIILVTVLISLKGFQDRNFQHDWSYSPYWVKNHKQHLRIIQHMFIHADYGHLFFNMFSFYMFGSLLEEILVFTYGFQGYLHFLIIYFIGGFASTLWPFYKHHNNDLYFSLGASGAVSSIIFATILWVPEMQMGFIFIPTMPAYIFGPLLLVLEYIAMRSGKTNIAHDAHIGGALFGIVYILFVNIDKGREFIQLIFG